MNELGDAIIGMREDEVIGVVRRMLEQGEDPTGILSEAQEAMGILGTRFQNCEIFLPELMMGGEIMAGITAELKPFITKGSGDHKRGTIVVGTVAGDIHDIGKDIVVAMLDANGYEVWDIGVDVPAEKFVEAIKSHRPQVVGLSGLLTAVFDAMKDTVDAISSAGLRDQVKIMIGGAPIDEQVLRYTGADGWGNDVSAALTMAAAWTGGEPR